MRLGNYNLFEIYKPNIQMMNLIIEKYPLGLNGNDKMIQVNGYYECGNDDARRGLIDDLMDKILQTEISIRRKKC